MRHVARTRLLLLGAVLVLPACDGAIGQEGAPGEQAPDERETMASATCNDGHTLVVAAHNDDELLWFQPFLTAPATRIVQAMAGAAPVHRTLQDTAYTKRYYGTKMAHLWTGYSTNDEYMRDYLRRDPCGAIAEAPPPVNPGGTYLTQGRDLKFSYAEIRTRLEPYIADPATWRVLSHNHWGEYGHAHHRTVAAVVRELATRYGKDVWMLAVTRVNRATADPATQPGSTTFYRNEQATLPGLQVVWKSFSHTTFNAVRQLYQSAMLPWPGMPNNQYDTWTWQDAKYDYPSGSRPFVKIVASGVDYTPNHLTRILTIRDHDATLYGSCGNTTF